MPSMTDGPALQTTTTTTESTRDVLPDGAACLEHWGVIRAEGEDAAQFLHGQLSNDFVLLDAHKARLAAYCSPKGRMLASVIGLKYEPQNILLLCKRDLLAPTLKRLSMFVLRSKVRLTDATADFQLWGLAGSATHAGTASAPWSMDAVGAARFVQLYPADGVSRQVWIAPVAEPAPTANAMDLSIWQWGEVRSGVPMVGAPIADALVPQMLNYESVGGVNFKKGCYPGQEVVARSQFRGTLKRRGYVAHCDAPLQAGQEIFLETDSEQPAGLVVQSAAHPAGGWDAMLSLQIGAAGSGTPLVLPGAAAQVHLLPLPYALLEDI